MGNKKVVIKISKQKTQLYFFSITKNIKMKSNSWYVIDCITETKENST